MENKPKKSWKPGFARLLLKWNREQNTRHMPWKGEKDPYRVWLSEVILQQTRVDQGLAYYNRFIRKYPDIHRLAAAGEEEVFKSWEGLGYYSRCRNLIATSKYISLELKGRFPADYESIRSLKGIGPYTAAAIASFAFNLPHAVVDGNVFRVLARISGVDFPIDSTRGKKYFTVLAGELLDKEQPGTYNQAIMDFGAVVCKPLAPECGRCVFRKYCAAYACGRINELPVKEKKIVIRKRWFYYFMLQYGNEVAVHRRNAADIWRGLYEFPLIETKKHTTPSGLLKKMAEKKWASNGNHELVSISPLFRQQLSHQLISGRFLTMRLKKKPALKEIPGPTQDEAGWRWVRTGDLKKFAFPRFINQWLLK